MKKLIFTIFSLILVLSFVTSALAQEEESMIAPDIGIIPPLPDRDVSGIFGQDHKYSIVFRGNGEAVVTLRVALTNSTDTDLSKVSLRVPKVEPENLISYQIIREKIGYQEPDYYQSYYRNSKYLKAEASFEGDTINIALPTSIAPEKSGAFFIYYRAFGYANKNIFGGFPYEFETLKADDTIRNLSVGINTDSDLFLKDAKGEVDYRFDTSAVQTLEAGNAALDTFVSRIGSGRIIKTASNLSALESYKVEGAYADSRLKLYAKEISIGVGIFLIFLIFFLGISFVVYKALKRKPEASGTSFLLSMGSSFVSAFIITLFTILLILITSSINQFFYYQYISFIYLFLVIISFGVYLILFLAPAIFIGLKRGFGWGVLTAILSVFWLIIFLAIAIFVIFLLGKGIPSPVFTRPSLGVLE